MATVAFRTRDAKSLARQQSNGVLRNPLNLQWADVCPVAPHYVVNQLTPVAAPATPAVTVASL
jgi:hypothetical protein